MSGPFSPQQFLAIHRGFHFPSKAIKNFMMNKCIPGETPKVKSKINLILEPASQLVKHGRRLISLNLPCRSVKPLRRFYTYKHAL